MRDLSIYHERTRRRGVNRPVYWTVRAVLQPLIQLYFWLGRDCRHHIPRSGAVILASNHRSFLDPFAIGCCLRRPVYFVAKRELFQKRWMGWVLNALGAFPVRRGESDEETVATARAVLERGDVVVIFPEGTRIRQGSLGKPKRGVGRLALEAGAPVVPIAVIGTERARRKWRISPCRVRIRFGRPLTFPTVDRPSPRLAAEVTARIWPCVALQWEWLGGLPPLRKAAVVGGGSMGTALATLFARAGLEVQLGCRAPGDRPADGLSDRVNVSTVSEIEFGGVDLVVFAVPASGLPAAVAQVGDRIGERTAVLVVSKGLVPPLGATPAHYVGARVRARTLAALGGPMHAGEAVSRGASVVLATQNLDLGDQLARVLVRGGLDVDRTDDVTGTELAGSAKNVAALAAAVAAASGMNAAGAAASRVFAEVEELALDAGARAETFAGLAGIGDLVATALAPHSRNRRAGELLAEGTGAEQIPSLIGGVAESLDTVPLLVPILEARGVDAPASRALRELVEGRMSATDWVARLHPPAEVAPGRAA